MTAADKQAKAVRLVVFEGAPLVTVGLVRAMIDAADPGGAIPVTVHSVTGTGVRTACGTLLEPDATDWPTPSEAALIAVIAGAQPDPTTYLPMGLRGFLHAALGQGATLLALEGGDRVVTALSLNAPVPMLRGLDAVAPIHAWIATQFGAAAAARAGQRIGWTPPPTGTPEAAFDPVDPIIARMQAMMQSRLDDPIPLDVIARRLGLSGKQLRHRCHRILGAAPAQVYLGARLDQARGLVEHTALPVAAIAQAAGFASPSSFTRAYRLRFGASPRRMRAAPARQPGPHKTQDPNPVPIPPLTEAGPRPHAQEPA